MLIVPASKVSVPLTVVIRIRSRAPEMPTAPPHQLIRCESSCPITPEATQIWVLIKFNVIAPLKEYVDAIAAETKNPVFMFTTAGDAPFAVIAAEPTYPEVVNDPDPS